MERSSRGRALRTTRSRKGWLHHQVELASNLRHKQRKSPKKDHDHYWLHYIRDRRRTKGIYDVLSKSLTEWSTLFPTRYVRKEKFQRANMIFFIQHENATIETSSVFQYAVPTFLRSVTASIAPSRRKKHRTLISHTARYRYIVWHHHAKITLCHFKSDCETTRHTRLSGTV